MTSIEVIPTSSELGNTNKGAILSEHPMKKSVNFVEQRQDGTVPELYAASGSDSMDSFEVGRASYEENVDAASTAVIPDATMAPPAPSRSVSPHPPVMRASSSKNFELAKSGNDDGTIDLRFNKELDEEGYKELLMFLQAPSSVVLQSILAYEPQASFGFVKNHVFEGLSDDENPELDADDYTTQIFPSRAARTAAVAGAVAGTAAVAAAASKPREVSQKDSMPAAMKHFTPDPNEKKSKAAKATAATAVVARSTSTRAVKEEMDPQRAAMPAAVRHFTPDPKEKKAVVYEKHEAPIAVRHFTPDWETELPPTVRESLDQMSPEERAKWISRPIAVQHFTSKFDEPSSSEVEYKPYEMPIAMKHFAPPPKEEKEYVPEPMPVAMQHFTPDWEAEKAKKKAANEVREPAPIAVQHFTPEWEVFIPPTVRESLANMTPEERKKWAETPIAVSHFTPYQPPKPASYYEKKEVPIAIQKFTPDPNAPPQKVELDWESMPVATRHFTPDPNVKKEFVPEPMPVAMKHFTPDWEAEKAKKAAAL